MNMRRILAGAAVVAMLALAGCGTREPVRGTVTGGETPTTTTTAAETTTTAAVQLGSTVGGVYQNTFIGIGCKFDSDWTIHSDEEIREMNQLAIDAMSDEYAKKLEGATILYDFAASKEDGTNININLEKLTAVQAVAVNAEKYVDLSIPTLKSSLTSAGLQVDNIEKVSLTFAGEDTFGAKIMLSTLDISFYETVVCLKRGNYMVCITVSSFVESDVDAILDSFYAL